MQQDRGIQVNEFVRQEIGVDRGSAGDARGASRARGRLIAGATGLALLVAGQVAPASAETRADGTLDPAFGVTSPNDLVLDVEALPSGKTLIAGLFTDYAGRGNLDYLARLEADGTVDDSFTPPVLNEYVHGMTVDVQGRILLTGRFTDVGGVASRDYLARVTADGALDATFTPPVLDNYAFDTVPTLSGDIYVGGAFSSVGGDAAYKGIVRLNQNGSLDAGFASPPLRGLGWVFDLELAAADAVVMVGNFADAGGDARQDYLARVFDTGSVDGAFAPPVLNDAATRVRRLPGGGFAVSGYFTDADGWIARDYLVKTMANGRLDESFTPPSFNSSVADVDVMADGRLLVVGNWTAADQDFGYGKVVRTAADGSLDRNFVPPRFGNTLSSSVSETIDGKVVVGGYWQSIGGDGARRYVTRLGYTVAGPVTATGTGFGSVVMGSGSRSATVTLHNTGVGTATISSLSSQGSGVRSTGGSCAVGGVLPAGGRCTVDLEWTPGQAGALADGKVSLAYPYGATGGAAPTTQVFPLSGTGVAPTPVPPKPQKPKKSKKCVKAKKHLKKVKADRKHTKKQVAKARKKVKRYCRA